MMSSPPQFTGYIQFMAPRVGKDGGLRNRGPATSMTPPCVGGRVLVGRCRA